MRGDRFAFSSVSLLAAEIFALKMIAHAKLSGVPQGTPLQMV
jgi:hypothetical protein